MLSSFAWTWRQPHKVLMLYFLNLLTNSVTCNILLAFSIVNTMLLVRHTFISVVYTPLKIVYNIHETALNCAIKHFFLIKNNECLGVNVLPQITGNHVSELSDFKHLLGGHAPIPPERTRDLRPLLSAPAGSNKRETTTSNLTESTVNRVWFLYSSLELGMLFRRSYFFIIFDKTINKSPSKIVWGNCVSHNGHK